MAAASKMLTPIEISDKAFLIKSTIERCPKTMMLRELVTNALEAAAAGPIGLRRVDISAEQFEGTAKLVIRNTGPSMNARELHDMCDLASSIRKRMALDENFGMGAKVASLPSNKHGLRFDRVKADESIK